MELYVHMQELNYCNARNLATGCSEMSERLQHKKPNIQLMQVNDLILHAHQGNWITFWVQQQKIWPQHFKE